MGIKLTSAKDGEGGGQVLGKPKMGKAPGNHANGGEATRKSLDLMSQGVPKGHNVKLSRHSSGGEMATRGTRGSGYGKGYHQTKQKGDRGSR